VQLSGPWRATIADDDLRRSAIGLDFDDGSWPEISVPGHWRGHPDFAGADGPLLYRHAFHLDVPAEGERRFVTFDGVFYQADVWLDGAYLGDPEGYFFPHTFDITSLAGLATDHVLAVEVACAPQRDRTAKRNLTGVLQHGDVIDPDWNPGGLWRPVRIESTGPVRIDRLRVLCRDVNDARAHLRLHSRLDSDQPRTVRLQTLVDGVLLDEKEQPLARGANEVDWNLDIADPLLWWPWTMGDQYLVDVEVRVVIGGEPSHRRVVRTGLREVSMDDWVMSVNGEPLFAKGANLAPTRAALADATPEEVRRDVELARDAGLDLVRVRGHVARPELYDAADELGVLVWQDFPMQWGYARTVRKQAVRQAREAVDLLGHHPSIAVWCAHNEPARVHDQRELVGASALRQIVGQQLPSWNRTVLDRWVKRAFETNDETRTAIAHSGVAPHLPQLDGTDSHLFFGWQHGTIRDLDGFAATMPRMVRFVSEFGAQSAPAAAEFLRPEQWPNLDWPNLDWPALVAHHGLDLGAMERHVPPAEYATFDDWREATQQHQAMLLRHQIETLRRLKYRPTGGFCFLSLNDAGPSIGWGVLDHERRPKLAYQAVVDACRPVIVVADQLPGHVQPGDALALDLHVISDVRRLLDAVECTATLRWPGGSHAWRWIGDVPPDSCVRVGTVQFVVPDISGELWLDLTAVHGDEVATNRYATRISPG
jgi:beta-mannosidase